MESVIKKKIAVDSCVFLNMIYFNDEYTKNKSKTALNYKINEDKIRYNETKIEIEKIINKINTQIDKLRINNVSGKNKFQPDVDTDMKIGPTTSSLEKSIEFLETDIAKKLNTIEKINSQEGKEKIKSFVENKKVPLEYLKAMKDEFDQHKATYNSLKSTLRVSNIYKKLINNEIEIYIPNAAFKEIKNHIIENQNRTGNPHSLYSQKSVNDLLNLCHPISLRSKRFNRHCAELADYLISSGAMKKETNSVKNNGSSQNSNGELGDASIMAECNILGLQLVTQNRKDFIYNKKDIENNKIVGESRRAKMRELFSEIPFCTDMLPCSVEEFDNENYHQISKHTHFSEKFNKQEKTNFAEISFC